MEEIFGIQVPCKAGYCRVEATSRKGRDGVKEARFCLAYPNRGVEVHLFDGERWTTVPPTPEDQTVWTRPSSHRALGL